MYLIVQYVKYLIAENRELGVARMDPHRRELIDRLDRLIYSISQRFAHDVTEAIRGKVTMSQYVVLKILSVCGQCTVSGVADKMQISTSAVTPLADRLVAMGLIGRYRDEKDRRVVWIHLTQKGQELIREIEDARRKVVDAFVSKLPEIELNQLVAILERLVDS